MGELEYLFVLLLAVTILVRLADVVGVPYPIVLVLAGLGLGLISGLPELRGRRAPGRRQLRDVAP